MVSIIKNQLLKHLSRYTKDLSSDKINLSTFKGEGELHNLQLDEKVLTDLLELPVWLRLTSAWCNHVFFRISWTKLKSVPITLSLDEVNITVETCELGRENAKNDAAASLQNLMANPGKYSFINKVIDGITILVNTVNVNFVSPAFTASIQMSRIRVESKTPKWMNGDLRVTRLKDPVRGQILIFKELSWQTVRIEASSTQDKSLTPLRLLTNQARCRITIKKRLADCSVLSSRLALILDNLLWVLTDSQLKAALHFVDSLSDLIKASTEMNQKLKASKKLETIPDYQAQQQPQQKEMTPLQKSFNAVDVRETSYHFFSAQIDLHLCDDEGDGRSCYPDLKDGGALKISVQNFQIDYYPFHLARASRNQWPKYKEASTPPALWLEQSLNQFRETLLNFYQPNRPPNHAPLERSGPTGGATKGDFEGSLPSTPTFSTPPRVVTSPVKKNVLEHLSKLMSACVVLRIEDFTLYRVTYGKNQMSKEFISGDKDRYSFPADMSAIHAEFTYFYYPGDFVFPLPSSKAFVHINPVQLTLDTTSLLWFSSFALNLHESLLRTSVGNSMQNSTHSSTSTLQPSNPEPSLMYMDVKLEAILPRVVFESVIDVSSQRDRPKIMQVQISRFSVTNIRETGTSRADLAQALHSLQEGSLVFSSGFPSKDGDLCIVTDRILNHVAAADVQTNTSPAQSQATSPVSTSGTLSMPRHALWTEPRDIWCMKLDPIWIDFHGARSTGNRSIPFLDAVPITLWVHGKSSDLMNNATSAAKSADLHVIAHVSNLISVQIDHYQFLFLLRLSEEFTEMATFLTLDRNRILKDKASDTSMIVGCVIPQIEVTLIMPSPTPGKESNGDGESVIPDSASLAEDLLFGNPMHPLKMMNPYSTSIDSPTSTMDPEPEVNPELPSSYVNVSRMEEAQSSAGPTSKSRTRNSVVETNFATGFLSMKKGFSNLINSAVAKTNIDDDTWSIASDLSSDSDNYSLVMVDSDKNIDCMTALFKFNPSGGNENALKVAPVEMASEVVEEMDAINVPYKTNMSSPSEPSDASSWKRRDLVSMVTFRLTTVELIRQNEGTSSSVRLQVAAVSCDQCGAIPWDELQTKFGARCRAWNMGTFNPGAPPCIQIRLEEQLNIPRLVGVVDKKSVLEWFTHKVDIIVKDLTLGMNMSTVIGLGDLTEDEIVPRPLPLEILVKNVKINLTEDRPPVNITSPGPIPINLAIGEMKIRRDKNGVFHIQPETTNFRSEQIEFNSIVRKSDKDKEMLSMQLILHQLKIDNDNLKRQLTNSEKVVESSRVKATKDVDSLTSKLQKANDEIESLLEDRKTLMDTVRSLQQQLSDALNSNIGSRIGSGAR